MNLAYLAAYLRREGVTVHLADFEVEPYSDGALRELLRSSRAVVVGISCWMAREAGIAQIEGYFIIGVDPDETAGDLEQTRRLIRELPWDFVSVAIIVPFPGTPVYDAMRSRGLIENTATWEDFVLFGRPPKWRTTHFTADQLLSFQLKLTKEFYLNPGYIARLSSQSGRSARFPTGSPPGGHI